MATEEQRKQQTQNDVEFNNSATLALYNKKGKYSINLLKYPDDLGGQDLLHYVQFSINARGKSEAILKKKKGLYDVYRSESAAGLTEDQLGSKSLRGATEAAAGVGAAAATQTLTEGAVKGAKSFASTAIAGKVDKAVNLSGAASRVIAVGSAAVGAAAAAGIAFSDILQPDQSQRISDVITLHVDGPPTVKYNAQYSNKELGTLAGVISGGAFESAGALKGTSETAAALGATFAKLPGAFGATNVGAALSASTKTTLNPFKEVIFESIDFRSFAFKYKFLPKNRQESMDVKKIINLFKYHMHPELSSSKLFFIYPSEFQITYFYKGAKNNYFHSFRPCVLESMEINYGGEQFSSFNDGNPTEVNLSLIFKETEILTKELITEEGNY